MRPHTKNQQHEITDYPKQDLRNQRATGDVGFQPCRNVRSGNMATPCSVNTYGIAGVCFMFSGNLSQIAISQLKHKIIRKSFRTCSFNRLVVKCSAFVNGYSGKYRHHACVCSNQKGTLFKSIEERMKALEIANEELLKDLNDLSEDTRTNFDDIYIALSEMAAKQKESEKPRKPIGLIELADSFC